MIGKTILKYALNCFILIIPILLWNILFAGSLPRGYSMELFWEDIPPIIGTTENVLRIIVFFLPLLMPLTIKITGQKIGLGIYLPFVGKEIAEIMNWKESFVGIIFLALVTSFPELVVSFSAAKLGAFEMILGNIAGSNLFNVAIIFFIDMFYIKGQILGDVSKNNISVGIIAILMNFIVFFAVIRQSKYRFLNIISLNAIILVILYFVNLFVSY